MIQSHIRPEACQLSEGCGSPAFQFSQVDQLFHLSADCTRNPEWLAGYLLDAVGENGCRDDISLLCLINLVAHWMQVDPLAGAELATFLRARMNDSVEDIISCDEIMHWEMLLEMAVKPR